MTITPSDSTSGKGEFDMDWKLCAIDDLRRYKQMKIGVLNSKDKLRLISAAASSPRTSLGKRNPINNPSLINTLVEKEKLSSNIKSTQKLLKIIERGLDSLTDEERALLEKFYMSDCPSNIRHLCEEFGYEQRSLYRKRDRALARFTLAMYGLEIS